VQLTVPITKEINGMITGTLRFGQNFRHFVDERIAVGLSYKGNKYVTVGSNYLYRASQPFRNRKSFESRWQHYVKFSFPVKKYLISNRNMVEYRFINLCPNV
jgi:hypothetical protein